MYARHLSLALWRCRCWLSHLQPKWCVCLCLTNDCIVRFKRYEVAADGLSIEVNNKWITHCNRVLSHRQLWNQHQCKWFRCWLFCLLFPLKAIKTDLFRASKIQSIVFFSVQSFCDKLFLWTHCAGDTITPKRCQMQFRSFKVRLELRK